MKILVTSGGTKIPIDKVRDITNMSKGTFGSKIATELLNMRNEVMFLKAAGSKSPMQTTINVREGFDDAYNFIEWFDRVRGYLPRYKELEYRTFDDYRVRLERWIKLERPNVVMLAAAVSDYGVENPFDGKIRSNDLLTIKLVQLPKIIHLIKTWHPDCKLVGFKMLVNSKESQLIEAAKKSIAENGCDMIVANDLADIREGKHRVHLVFPNAETKIYQSDPNDADYLAKMVAAHTLVL